ncbi:histone acetyltransferase MYST2 [Phaeosphaeriaceae sp. PMI808]|nr:histone acetyltransferase MYST2 [Phaeosphaeriaceae sp. PMI808]
MYDTGDHSPITWPLQSFSVKHDYRPTGPWRLLLDRANGELGIVSAHQPLATMALAQFPDDEPIYFEAKTGRAASWRPKCKKVSLLFEHMQIDLEFITVDEAHRFLHTVEDIAMVAGNHHFYSYEVPCGVPFVRADFDMVKHGYVDRLSHNWLGMNSKDTEWPRLRRTGEWSDFTIVAEGKSFAVHRIRLCKASHYFNAVCSGGFAESANRTIELPESARIVATLLDELYDTYNPTTGSLFTNFALRSEMEKERALTDLLGLFLACDKYSLEKIKHKVSQAVIDRLPFIKDALTVVDFASEVYIDYFPAADCGLKEAVLVQMDARLPTILKDDSVWEEYSSNRTLLRALHMAFPRVHFTSMAPDAGSLNGTSPAPTLALPQKGSVSPNVLEVVFGSLLIKPWYPSFYPEELVGRKVERLYVCQWCFKYSKELMPFLAHLKACPHRNNPPPGVNIYTKDNYSLFEIDGEKHKLYAQNLSLFAKLFLDTKSVFYDVTTFLYYLLVAHEPTPSIENTGLNNHGIGAQGQVVGFFSKEKMSWDNNNLACILVFPPWQKQGLGQILMGASYEMSRREGRLGGPEKPLSDLGRLAYIHYWSATLARTILAWPAKKTLTVLDLREKTYIVPEDIIATLQAMHVLEHKKRANAEAVINKANVRAWAESHHVDLHSSPVDPEAFVVRESSRSASEE